MHKATASDVAELVGMSKWTVLRAFKPGASISATARNEVLAAAKQLGFRPNLLASSLKKRSTNLIGVVADEFTNPHTLKMLNDVTRQLNKRGYMTLLLNIDSGADYHSVLQMAGQLQVDGLIYMATILDDKLIVTAQELHHIPFVHVCRNTDSKDVDVINVDGFAAGSALGNVLVEQGFQRFGYMKGPNTASDHLLRMEGYSSCLETAGRSLDQVLIAGHYDRVLAWEVMTEYLHSTPENERIDALFCENDVLAFGVLQAIRDFDSTLNIGVVGFDDVDEARTSTWNLTTWNQRADLQIAEAINRLIDHQPDESGAWRQGELCLRQSHIKK
ncbi:LacI family DNA-binding transcriptional regulator [Erwinia sp.]|uniref:LacI family DNA-binding transcriptional regulator n=1 Tax=Erwinia citreus TaxID=558 RepID=UPI003C73D0C8